METIRIVDIPIDGRTREVVVRHLVDWGYLDAGACIDEDEPDYWETLGDAIGRALPRLLIETRR